MKCRCSPAYAVRRVNILHLIVYNILQCYTLHNANWLFAYNRPELKLVSSTPRVGTGQVSKHASLSPRIGPFRFLSGCRRRRRHQRLVVALDCSVSVR